MLGSASLPNGEVMLSATQAKQKSFLRGTETLFLRFLCKIHEIFSQP